jgi:DNA-binding MarR family transcriptional regulator
MWESQYGLSVTDWRVLAVIARYGQISAKEAATHSSTEPFHITRAVDHLVKANLVRRQVDPSDKRKVRLTLTDKGRRVHGEIELAISRVEAHLMDGLGSSDQQAARDALSLLEERALELLASALTWKDFK